MFLSKRPNGIYHINYKKSNGRMTSVSTKTKLKSEANKFFIKFASKATDNNGAIVEFKVHGENIFWKIKNKKFNEGVNSIILEKSKVMKQFLLLIIVFVAASMVLIAQDNEAKQNLEQYTGLYGDPEESNEYRKLWVMVSCDGQLVTGALWGDVAPWWMKSEGNSVFTYKDSFSELRMEFEKDENGNVIRMNHDLSGIKTPLERLGPIPEDWEPCVEKPLR